MNDYDDQFDWHPGTQYQFTFEQRRRVVPTLPGEEVTSRHLDFNNTVGRWSVADGECVFGLGDMRRRSDVVGDDRCHWGKVRDFSDIHLFEHVQKMQVAADESKFLGQTGVSVSVNDERTVYIH